MSVVQNLLTEERRKETKHPEYAGHFGRAHPIEKRRKPEHLTFVDRFW
jgi:hypothetical protein